MSEGSLRLVSKLVSFIAYLFLWQLSFGFNFQSTAQMMNPFTEQGTSACAPGSSYKDCVQSPLLPGDEVASSLILNEKMATQIFLERVRKLWNEWQVRVMVLLSLSLQIILIIFGSRRKYTTRMWIKILVWSAYLLADWVATVTLGNLATIRQGTSNVNSSNPTNVLQAFRQLLEKAKKPKDAEYDIKLCNQLFAQRGDYVLEKKNCLNELKWTTTDVEFDRSFLLWHIATNLCYYDDFGRRRGANIPNSKCEISRLLSDYMLYLLVMCPFMLPTGIGEIRYRDTCAETMRFFKQKRKAISCIGDAVSALLGVNIDSPSLESLEEYKGDISKSVLFYGCRLAKQLQLLEYERKWEIISEMWVEMLAYAASHCGWKEHAQQLRKGGELLTHVCLLMAHLGLSKQYQIKKQYTHDVAISGWAVARMLM